MRNETINLCLLASLAALWAALELTLGSALHAFGVPFAGALLTAVALPVLLVARKAVPRMGSVSAMALCTAFLKVAIFGGVALGAAIAIFVEGILVDLSLGSGKPRPFNAALGGGLALGWSFVHPFFYLTLVAGWPLGRVLARISAAARAIAPLPARWEWVALALVLFLHLSAGAVSGWIGFRLCESLDRRLNFSCRFGASRVHADHA